MRGREVVAKAPPDHLVSWPGSDPAMYPGTIESDRNATRLAWVDGPAMTRENPFP